MIHPTILALHDGTWTGECVHCGAPLTMDDLRAQRVILAGSLSAGFEVCCVGHIQTAYRNHKPGDPVPELVSRFARGLVRRLAEGGES